MLLRHHVSQCAPGCCLRGRKARIGCCFGHGMTPIHRHICRYCEWTSPIGAVLRTGAAVYCTTGQAALGPLLATAS